MKPILTIAATALLASTASLNAKAPAPVAVELELPTRFLGLPVGKLNAIMKVNGKKYSFRGTAETSGLVKAITPTKAKFAAWGTVGDKQVTPRRHRTDYSQRKKAGKLVVAFKGSNVAKTTAVPKVKYKDGTVPVKKAHLAGALDPASALIVPVAKSQIGNGKAICNRTVPVWDGKNRFDLVMRFAGESQAKAKGFSGPVYTCNIRYKSVSGHRPFKDNVKYWNANRDASITLARIGDSSVYGLFGFDVKTESGRAKGMATTFRPIH